MKTYLATVQVVFTIPDDQVPEDAMVDLIERASFATAWRYYPKAPHYGFFRPYEYDWTKFYHEEAE